MLELFENVTEIRFLNSMYIVLAVANVVTTLFYCTFTRNMNDRTRLMSGTVSTVC